MQGVRGTTRASRGGNLCRELKYFDMRIRLCLGMNEACVCVVINMLFHLDLDGRISWLILFELDSFI